MNIRLLKSDHAEWYRNSGWREGDIVEVRDEEALLFTVLGVGEVVDGGTPERPFSSP